MISLKSAKTFIYLNSFLVGLSIFLHHLNFYNAFVRNLLITLFIGYGTRHKQPVHPHQKQQYTLNDYLYFFSTSVIQCLTEQIIPTVELSNYFLIRLFCFEIVLDFFHYCFHRFLHNYFKCFHRVHHHYPYPQLLNTFYHHPLDLIIIESIPTLIAFYLFAFSPFQTQLVLVYKDFIEISGHSGKRVAPSSCFPLCVWLPRVLGIELYTEDHDLHHSTGGCNYAKRFRLWDRIFGTFSSNLN